MMPTLLTNRKMSPELRARVEASVTGRQPTEGSRWTPRSKMWLRALGAAAVVAAVAGVGLSKQQADRELEAQRAQLLEGWQKRAAGLDAEERAIAARVEPWLRRGAGQYAGDWVAEEVDGADRLDKVLGRPTVYVRGPRERFANGDALATIALDAAKDAFVLCLLDPPRNRHEKAILKRVRSAYGKDERMQRATANVASLGAAFAGLPVLAPEWRERIAKADDPRELSDLERALRRAPVEAAKRAAKATLLLYVMDEANDRPGPSELDGERPHDVRVGLVDLAREKPLLRARLRVDPSWLSDMTRAEFARGMDSCTLAYDVRQAVTAPEAEAESVLAR